ncbi:MAG: ABC transporter ATP-binding protein [Christensenellaceae bacterium]
MNGNIKWLSSNLGKLKKNYFLIILLSAISSALMVFFALSIKDLINCALATDATYRLLIRQSVISFVLLASSVLISLLNKILTDKCRFLLEIKIKKKMFLSLVDKDYLAVTKFQSGEVLNRVQRDSEIVANGIVILPTLVSMVIKIVLSVAVLLGLQPLFTLILIAVGIVCIGLSLLFRRYFKKLHKATRESDGRVMSFFNEGFNNVIALKVFSSKKKLEDTCSNLTEKYKNALLKQRNLYSALISAFSFGFMALYLATIIWGGVGFIRHDDSMSFGLILSMIQLIAILQSPFANISAVISVYYEMLSSVDRLKELENLPEDKAYDLVDPEAYNSVSRICGKSLTFDYGREKVFVNAEFSIGKGDVCLIKGRSGIGKSTLFKLLLGVLSGYEGELYFDSGDSRLPINASTRSLFSYVPQGNMLFYGTIRDNVCLLNEKATESEIQSVIETCALDFINDFKDGLDTVVGEGGVGLSEGQAQRVAIARAVLSKRPILLLDEATSSLDSLTETKILSNIKNKAKDMTVILISHRPMPKDLADITLTFKDGVILKE